MKCMKSGDIPENVCYKGNCPACKSGWEISEMQLDGRTQVLCPMCLMDFVTFTKKIGSGYTKTCNPDQPTRHYFNGVEVTTGVYRFYWKAGGESVGAIQSSRGVDMWVMIANWVNVAGIETVLTACEKIEKLG